MPTDPASNYQQLPDHQKNYALSGKIMLSSIIILFVVVIVLVLLHLYARWYLRRLHRHNDTRRRNRRTHIVFHVDNNNSSSPPNGGLDATILKSLPVFVYSSQKPNQNLVECAVCLSEFEDGETGRVLPKCKHGFHTECIDMWFHSHSTCPLCRAPVEPVQPGEELEMKAATTNEPGSSGWFNETTSFQDRRKGIDVRIDIPSRNELVESSFRMMSPTLGFRSPGSHLQSLKRILTMSRKSPAVSPSGGVGPSSVNPSVEPDKSDIESVSQQ
uniref:RING-H2 finger protein ATL64 n=1 Tax=Erigeron canadensis TaxID=72917 RepID=UPI001CB8AE48|nr:RING-H2 finger protein ATL64 [Erigeron canadensis]